MLRKFIVTAVLMHSIAAVSQTACSNMALGPMAPLNGFVPSPNDAWHQDISAAATDSLSSWILSSAADLAGAHLHADFSSVAGGNLGTPYTVVDSKNTPGTALPITLHPLDSDITLIPIPAVLPVEGTPGECPSDSQNRRAIIIDRNQCVMYEIYQAAHCTNGWTGSNVALWDLKTAEKRPYGYAAASSAGLSVFEGLIRYDEIVAGVINHAIRFTARNTQTDVANGLFTAPATHAAGNTKNTDNIMGMRLRLRAGFDISGFSTTNKIILTALKKYGMILADNGPDLNLEGTPDARWDDQDLSALQNVLASNLELVKMGALYDSNTAPKGTAPVIASFTASATTIPAGSSVTLTPNVTGASYSYIDRAGFVRGPVAVSPTATTTYTLTSRNEFGSTSASIKITVGGQQNTSTLTFAAIPAQTFGTAPFLVNASSRSTGAIMYSVVSGPATIAGATVTVTGIGTIVLKATQAPAGFYGAATATTSFTVSPGNPGLAFVPMSDVADTVAPLTVSTTTSSAGSISYAVASGPATIAGNILTLTGAGTVVLQAFQVASGFYKAATATTSFQVQAAPAAGGQVSMPVSSGSAVYLHITPTGNVYLLNGDVTTDPAAGLWVANASACEYSPATCAWTPIHVGEPTSAGTYDSLREMVDIDATHELAIFGFNGHSGACTNCSIQILNTTTNTYTPVTLAGKPAGESPVCMARDSSGIFYTMLNYHAGIWKSTDTTATTWIQVTSDYTTLPGLVGSGGNVYTCKVYGQRIYFGGEGGVISCNLTFSSCSQDRLPFGTGSRNFTGLLADVDSGSPKAPTMTLACCKQDTSVAGYVPFSRYSGGAWTQLTTSSGLPQYGQQLYFETFDLAVGTGTARRYYVMFFNSSTPNVAYKSTDSTGTSFALYAPPQWPTLTTADSLRQMTSDPRNGLVWSLFTGSSGSRLYITP